MRRFAAAPLYAVVLIALGACGSDDDDGGGDDSVEPETPTDAGAGLPFNDNFLTLDEALSLAATGQTITVPSLGGATPPTEPVDPEPEEPGEPTTPFEPVDPPEPVGPSEPIAPTEPVDPVDPEPVTPPTDNGGEPPVTGGAGDGSSTPDGGGSPAPGGSSLDEVGNDTSGQTFTASTTEGFTGEVLADGSVRVRWPRDRGARGYNTYRDAEYVTTVFDTEWIDTDTYDGNFYYEIETFDNADNLERYAFGLTVPVRGSGKTNPVPDNRGTPRIDDYELIFAEEFDGDSLDLNLWNTAYLWGDELIINEEEQHYVDIENEPDFGFNPFDVSGGTLKITSAPTPPELADRANGQPYLSGVITSYDSFQFTYGYAETRAKMPFGKGLWPAFWLLNAFYGDDDPEIDIMEFIGDDQDVAYHTYHYYDNGELRSTQSHPVPGIDFVGDFHTFAVDWRPGLLIFYVDGRETHRISDPRVSDQEMYIIANTALGGWWAGSPNAETEFPAEYEIDYIRVYQKSGPYADSPFADGAPSAVPANEAVPGTSPSHRPPLDLFPGGAPMR